MSSAGRIAAAATALLLLGAGGQAHAQAASNLKTKPAAVDTSRWSFKDSEKTLKLDSRKWGVKLNLDQSVERDPRRKDVEAGAYYRITPSLRVGGAVQFDEKAEERRGFADRDRQPRVRLETAFQF
jgi:hypothetical protein